jgi:hypothetical protein
MPSRVHSGISSMRLDFSPFSWQLVEVVLAFRGSECIQSFHCYTETRRREDKVKHEIFIKRRNFWYLLLTRSFAVNISSFFVRNIFIPLCRQQTDNFIGHFVNFYYLYVTGETPHILAVMWNRY